MTGSSSGTSTGSGRRSGGGLEPLLEVQGVATGRGLRPTAASLRLQLLAMRKTRPNTAGKRPSGSKTAAPGGPRRAAPCRSLADRQAFIAVMLTSVAFTVMENQSIHRAASPNDAPKRRKLSSFLPVAAIPSLNAAVGRQGPLHFPGVTFPPRTP